LQKRRPGPRKNNWNSKTRGGKGTLGPRKKEPQGQKISEGKKGVTHGVLSMREKR